MKYSEDCLKILAQSQVQVTVEDFIPLLSQFRESKLSDFEYNVELIRCFGDTVKQTVNAVNFPLLREIVFSLTQKDVSYSIDLAPESSNDDLCKQVSKISEYLNELSMKKAEITHYLILLQHASNALESYVKPINSIFESDALLPKTRFGSVKGKQAVLASIMSSVESPLRQIKQYIKDLNNYLDNVISSENNRLLRLESSIRLILNTRVRQSTFNGATNIEGVGIDTL